MVRRIITIILAALAAIALCALAAPHAHASTWEDAQSGPDGGGTVVDGTPPAGDEGGGTIDVPQSGRGPSTEEWPGPGGRTHLRDILRPCVTEADAYDGCYDASRGSGLWRSPDGGEYRTWDDGAWEWAPASLASDGTADADMPEDTADAPEPAYAAPEGAPDAESEDAAAESAGDGDVLPSVAADAPEALTDADDAMVDDAPDDSAAAPTDDGQYAPDGSRVALAHTGPSAAMAATLAMGAAAALMAGAALMALARADH